MNAKISVLCYAHIKKWYACYVDCSAGLDCIEWTHATRSTGEFLECAAGERVVK